MTGVILRVLAASSGVTGENFRQHAGVASAGHISGWPMVATGPEVGTL